MIYIFIAGVIFLTDYVLKEHVNSTRLQGSTQKVLGGRLLIRNCHNEGAVLGLAKDKLPGLVGLSAFLLGGVGWDFLKQLFRKGSGLLKLAYALVLGGGLNNFYERRSKGYVTDYVSVPVKNQRLSKIVFNLSDVVILGGSILMVLAQLLPRTGKEKKERKQKAK